VSEEKKITEEQTEEEQGFWAKNIISIILIVFLIVSGVYAFNRDTEDKSVEEKVEEIKNEGEETEANDDEKSEDVATENTDIQKSDTKITIKANAGDGVTHLARKAVAEYSKDKEITLSKEQKIYAETVLKNKYYKHHLNLSQELEFEISDLAETVEKSQNLSEKEIQAWSKYTHLVPSL
jgi:FtsZ-interacting cell division protein ZipA